MHFTHFTVGEGEVFRVDAGTEIIASEGIKIAGDLIVDGSKPGDILLTAEDGNIVVSGRVIVEDATGATNAQTVEVRAASITSKASATPKAGTSIIITAKGANRDVILLGFPSFQSGRGQDALDETIVSPLSSRHEGEAGANGGDIILRAPLGAVRLPQSRVLSDPDLFGLGDGGDGADVEVDRLGFNTTETSIEIVGGRGGNSGRLVVEGTTVEGVPTLQEFEQQAEFIAGGSGGRGGHVLWDNTPVGVVGEKGALLEKTYPLTEMIVKGGDGGDGARDGGRGGTAMYWSGRPTREPGEPTASASAYGGNGGAVFASPVPLGVLRGGEGGSFSVWGNAGPDGDATRRDGGDGGDALGQGGDGGDVSNDVLYNSAVGGPGGHSEDAQTRMGQELPNRISGSYATRLYGVIAGHGGEGYKYDAKGDCDGCWGGDGGDSGSESAYGGNGGSVPSSLRGSEGGRGGDVWTVGRAGTSFGGDGNPPGKGGCNGTRLAQPGAGGNGEVSRGPGSELVPDPFYEEGECESFDGDLCGEDEECTLEPPPTPSCGEVGSSYGAHLSTDQGSGSEVLLYDELGVYTIQNGTPGWLATATYPVWDANGLHYESNTAFIDAALAADTFAAIRLNKADCLNDGTKLFPDGTVYKLGSNTFWFNGCTERLGIPSCLSSADYDCQVIDGTGYMVQIGNGTCDTP
jgi:hypothetical protein